MLEADSLATLLSLPRRASAAAAGSGMPPGTVLLSQEGSWRRVDVRRLSRQARIAASAGDLPDEVAQAVGRLSDRLRGGGIAALSADGPWVAALRWAQDDLVERPPYDLPPGMVSREQEVGKACARLRGEGYEVEIDGLGCRLTKAAESELLRRVDGLANCLGGIEVLQQLFRVLRDGKRLRDGTWLLGDLVPPPGLPKAPTLPFGWLFSLGLKHVAAGRKLRRPEIAWRNLTSLVRDCAALANVERYSKMERLNVTPGELLEVLTESVGWHQLFSFQRYRPDVVLLVVRAMQHVLTSADWTALDFDPAKLSSEIRCLFELTAPDRLTLMGRHEPAGRFPTLAGGGLGRSGSVNKGFLDPSDAPALNHAGIIFFESRKGWILLPTTVTAAHVATFVVTSMRRRLPRDRANEVAGKVFEFVTDAICRRASGALVESDIHYTADKELQIDVLVREEQEGTVLEVKSKALTAQAMSGDLLKYLSDYKGSYLDMLLQLARHERHLRAGAPGLPTGLSGVSLSKVAVSPLTHGPLSDPMLGLNVFTALARSGFVVGSEDHAAARELRAIERRVAEVMAEVRKLYGSTVEDERRVFTDLMRYHWIDLAQLAWLIDCYGSVAGGLKRIRHVTFGTHDLWHDLALLQDLDEAGNV